jgi:beta-glucuronidase
MFTHNRNTVDLNGIWKFNPDPYQRCRQQKWWLKEGDNSSFFPCFNMEGLWETQVPSTWKKEFEELKWYDGHANYVKEFALDAVPGDMEAFLCFDAVTYRSEIYLNGHTVGVHDWGYSPFQFRVTGMLQKTNRLFVLVDNFMREDRVPGIRCDWNNDGGITGGVKLIFVPKTYIENFRTSTCLEGDEAVIQVQVASCRLQGGEEKSLPVTVEISELGVKEQLDVPVNGKGEIEIRLPWTTQPSTANLRPATLTLWSPDHPKLYEVKLTSPYETLEDVIGFREIRTEGIRILLNGEELRLYGVAVHSEFPETGRAATEEGIQLMLEKARELGCNFLRCAHYPYADIFARAMDRAGMLWWEEVPVYWLTQVHAEPQKGYALGMLREMIVRDWNRASLIFWSVSNECAGDGSPAGAHRSLEGGNYPYWVEACRLVRELDPSRLISSADAGHRVTTANGWTPDAGDAFDSVVKGQDWSPGHPDAFYELLDVLGANLYVGRPGENPTATDKFVEMLRRFNKPLMITEFGSMSATDDALEGRAETDLGHPARHALILREAYRAMAEHPEIVGYVPWALMDVRVPMHWRWYNRGSGTFAYGLLDNQYRKKQVFDVVKDEIARLRAVYEQPAEQPV